MTGWGDSRMTGRHKRKFPGQNEQVLEQKDTEFGENTKLLVWDNGPTRQVIP